MRRKIAYAAAGLAALVVIGGVGDSAAPETEARPIESAAEVVQPTDTMQVEAPSQSGALAPAATAFEGVADRSEPAGTDTAASTADDQDPSASADDRAAPVEAPTDSGIEPAAPTPAPAPTTTTVPPTTTTTTAPEIPPVDVDPDEIEGLLSDIEQLLAGLDDAMQQGDDLP